MRNLNISSLNKCVERADRDTIERINRIVRKDQWYALATIHRQPSADGLPLPLARAHKQHIHSVTSIHEDRTIHSAGRIETPKLSSSAPSNRQKLNVHLPALACANANNNAMADELLASEESQSSRWLLMCIRDGNMHPR